MKTTLLLFLFLCSGSVSAQNKQADRFTYIDKAGNQVAVDLSVMPVFLDSTFFKENIFFACYELNYSYSISDLMFAKNIKHAYMYHTEHFNPKKKRQVAFMRVYLGVPVSGKLSLEDAMISMKIGDFVLVIKRTSKLKHIVSQQTLMGWEI